MTGRFVEISRPSGPIRLDPNAATHPRRATALVVGKPGAGRTVHIAKRRDERP